MAKSQINFGELGGVGYADSFTPPARNSSVTINVGFTPTVVMISTLGEGGTYHVWESGTMTQNWFEYNGSVSSSGASISVSGSTVTFSIDAITQTKAYIMAY